MMSTEPTIATTLGPVGSAGLQAILPHEHVFIDVRPPDHPEHAVADPRDVIELMGPELARAQAAGVSLIAEASTVGVGRRVDILKSVSEATGFPLIAPTGIYREQWIPEWARSSTTDELTDWMVRELTVGIADSGVVAGWIKLGASADGLSPGERQILQAAAAASRVTGAVIGSHTTVGMVARTQLDLIEELGVEPGRYIWVHTGIEPDFDLHLKLARRGAWIAYDTIGGVGSDALHLERVLRVFDAGLGDRLLLSQDRGWYDAAQPGGGKPRPFDYLTMCFVPQLRSAGLDDSSILQLIRDNPFRAFARTGSPQLPDQTGPPADGP